MHVIAPPSPSDIETGCHCQYLSMLDVFQKTDGVGTGDEVAQRLTICPAQPISKMARWSVDRIVVRFHWRSQTLALMFQCDPFNMTLRNESLKSIAHWSTCLTTGKWLSGSPSRIVDCVRPSFLIWYRVIGPQSLRPLGSTDSSRIEKRPSPSQKNAVAWTVGVDKPRSPTGN
jgi:hypothetical protein